MVESGAYIAGIQFWIPAASRVIATMVVVKPLLLELRFVRHDGTVINVQACGSAVVNNHLVCD